MDTEINLDDYANEKIKFNMLWVNIFVLGKKTRKTMLLIRSEKLIV